MNSQGALQQSCHNNKSGMQYAAADSRFTPMTQAGTPFSDLTSINQLKRGQEEQETVRR